MHTLVQVLNGAESREEARDLSSASGEKLSVFKRFWVKRSEEERRKREEEERKRGEEEERKRGEEEEERKREEEERKRNEDEDRKRCVFTEEPL